MAIDKQKLSVANRVLATFTENASIVEGKAGHLCVQWMAGGKQWMRQWQCRGQDFYPVWSHRWPYGGTSTVALSQLVRWVQGKPVFPIKSWMYWASEKVRLIPDHGWHALAAAGYPDSVKCVLCGEEPKGCDWWSLDGLSGPCCSFNRCVDERRARA